MKAESMHTGLDALPEDARREMSGFVRAQLSSEDNTSDAQLERDLVLKDSQGKDVDLSVLREKRGSEKLEKLIDIGSLEMALESQGVVVKRLEDSQLDNAPDVAEFLRSMINMFEPVPNNINDFERPKNEIITHLKELGIDMNISLDSLATDETRSLLTKMAAEYDKAYEITVSGYEDSEIKDLINERGQEIQQANEDLIAIMTRRREVEDEWSRLQKEQGEMMMAGKYPEIAELSTKINEVIDRFKEPELDMTEVSFKIKRLNVKMGRLLSESARRGIPDDNGL